MKTLFFSLFLFFLTQVAFSKPAKSVEHTHDGRSHSHPLPQSGINHTHNSVKAAQVNSVTQATTQNCKQQNVKKVTFMLNQRGRVDWSHSGNNLIAFDKRGTDKYYDVYTMKPDGSSVRCLSCNHPDLPSKNIGQPAWHPSGRYLVMPVQKAKHPRFKIPIAEMATNPGAGLYNDLWVLDMKTNRATPLTNLPADTNFGTLHPHFSHDGKKLSWSQMYRKASFIRHQGITGYWKLHVADFSVVGGLPKLSNEKIYQPGKAGMFENHGFSLDNKKLVFQSNMQSNKKKCETDLYQYNLQTRKLEKLTTSDLNEHGIYSPDGKRIAYMSSTGNNNKGTDWWLMNADGSCKKRLTFFNQPGHQQYKGRKIISADLSWRPDGRSFLGYFHDVDLANVLAKKVKGEGHALIEFGAN